MHILRKPASNKNYVQDPCTLTTHSHDISNVGISFQFSNAGGKTDFTIVIPNEEIIDLMTFMLSALKMGQTTRRPTNKELAEYVSSLLPREE